MKNDNIKFSNEKVTQNGKPRAFVDLVSLDTIWINSGTRCNLECANCYIESSPTNDSLLFIKNEDVNKILSEIKSENYPVKLIGITGGEPFLNSEMCEIIESCLKSNLETLVLTNAYRAIDRFKNKLIILKNEHKNNLHIRVSLDHHTKTLHEKERGVNTFEPTIKNIVWLFGNGFNLSIAGRSISNEQSSNALKSYIKMFNDNNVQIESSKIVIFPEMDLQKEVPEITTDCWEILNKKPQQQMCSSERMIVKRKGEENLTVLPCTLIAHDPNFNLGKNLKAAKKRVYLNHKFCAQFCVLGGASCSSTK